MGPNWKRIFQRALCRFEHADIPYTVLTKDLLTLPVDPEPCIDFATPQEASLVSISPYYGVVDIFSLPQLEHLQHIDIRDGNEVPNSDTGVAKLAMSNCGKFVACVLHNRVILLDSRDKTTIFTHFYPRATMVAAVAILDRYLVVLLSGPDDDTDGSALSIWISDDSQKQWKHHSHYSLSTDDRLNLGEYPLSCRRHQQENLIIAIHMWEHSKYPNDDLYWPLFYVTPNSITKMNNGFRSEVVAISTSLVESEFRVVTTCVEKFQLDHYDLTGELTSSIPIGPVTPDADLFEFAPLGIVASVRRSQLSSGDPTLLLSTRRILKRSRATQNAEIEFGDVNIHAINFRLTGFGYPQTVRKIIVKCGVIIIFVVYDKIHVKAFVVK
jgi:hypothetical protein